MLPAHWGTTSSFRTAGQEYGCRELYGAYGVTVRWTEKNTLAIEYLKTLHEWHIANPHQARGVHTGSRFELGIEANTASSGECFATSNVDNVLTEVDGVRRVGVKREAKQEIVWTLNSPHVQCLSGLPMQEQLRNTSLRRYRRVNLLRAEFWPTGYFGFFCS